MTNPDEHRMNFTDGDRAKTEPEAARSTQAASATVTPQKPEPKISDMFLMPMAAGVFRVSGQPAGAPQPTAEQAAKVFYEATREQLDALNFDEYLKQAIAESTGGDVEVSPWWLVALGFGFMGFNAWSMSRMYRPKKEKPDKKQSTPTEEANSK